MRHFRKEDIDFGCFFKLIKIQLLLFLFLIQGVQIRGICKDELKDHQVHLFKKIQDIL